MSEEKAVDLDEVTVLRAELDISGIPFVGKTAASFTVMPGFRAGLQKMVGDYIEKPEDFRWRQEGYKGIAEFRGPRRMAFDAQNRLRHKAARKFLGKLKSLGASYLVKEVGSFSLKPNKKEGNEESK